MPGVNNGRVDEGKTGLGVAHDRCILSEWCTLIHPDFRFGNRIGSWCESNTVHPVRRGLGYTISGEVQPGRNAAVVFCLHA